MVIASNATKKQQLAVRSRVFRRSSSSLAVCDNQIARDYVYRPCMRKTKKTEAADFISRVGTPEWESHPSRRDFDVIIIGPVLKKRGKKNEKKTKYPKTNRLSLRVFRI